MGQGPGWEGGNYPGPPGSLGVPGLDVFLGIVLALGVPLSRLGSLEGLAWSWRWGTQTGKASPGPCKRSLLEGVSLFVLCLELGGGGLLGERKKLHLISN